MLPHALLLAASSLTPALVGLLGVVVGAAINGYAQWVFTRRRERSEGLSQGRLVEADLARAAGVAEQCIDSPFRHAAGWSDDLETSAWRDGRAVLASRLDRVTWLCLRDAFDAIAALRRSLQTGDAGDDRALERTVAQAKRALQAIGTAQAALTSSVGEGDERDEGDAARGR
jgi:hypothetical protein